MSENENKPQGQDNNTQVANFQTTGKTEIAINGKKYELVLSGDLALNLKPIGDIPDPDPGNEPGNGGEIDPNIGTIKTGKRWSKNPGKAETWKVSEMTDADKKGLWEIVAADNLNVIADLPSKDVALRLVEYFKTNPFPPKGDTEIPGNGNQGPGPVIPIEGTTVSGIMLPVNKEDLTGKVRLDDYYYNPNNGLRIDFEDNPKDGSYVNNVCVVYGTFVGDPTGEEDRGIKWSWDSHSDDGQLVNTYMVNIRNGDGQTRSRIEVHHPHDYRTLVDYGEQTTGTPVKKGQLWSIMGVRRTVQDAAGKVKGVLLQLYEDQGIVDNKPGNKWVKLLEYMDTEYKITDYSEHGMEITGRFDDNKGDKNIKIEKALVAELKPIIQ